MFLTKLRQILTSKSGILWVREAEVHATMSIPIFHDPQSGFTFGLGDSNQDGRIDFDFGIRNQSYHNGPWGSGHSGAEIGFNTDRGLYLGGDTSNHNFWGSSGGGGRVFQDGGIQSGHWSNDVFGNYHSGGVNTGPGWANTHSNGGNWVTGDYHGHQSHSNPIYSTRSDWAGNRWTGAQVGTHSYGDIFGGHHHGGHIRLGTPPFVPHHGHGHYGGCGCQSVQQFMCF